MDIKELVQKFANFAEVLQEVEAHIGELESKKTDLMRQKEELRQELGTIQRKISTEMEIPAEKLTICQIDSSSHWAVLRGEEAVIICPVDSIH